MVFESTPCDRMNTCAQAAARSRARGQRAESAAASEGRRLLSVPPRSSDHEIVVGRVVRIGQRFEDAHQRRAADVDVRLQVAVKRVKEGDVKAICGAGAE